MNNTMKKTYKTPEANIIKMFEKQSIMVDSIIDKPYSDVSNPNNNLGKDNDIEYFGW